jgi:hypothetical protein
VIRQQAGLYVKVLLSSKDDNAKELKAQMWNENVNPALKPQVRLHFTVYIHCVNSDKYKTAYFRNAEAAHSISIHLPLQSYTHCEPLRLSKFCVLC